MIGRPSASLAITFTFRVLPAFMLRFAIGDSEGPCACAVERGKSRSSPKVRTLSDALMRPPESERSWAVERWLNLATMEFDDRQARNRVAPTTASGRGGMAEGVPLRTTQRACQGISIGRNRVTSTD